MKNSIYLVAAGTFITGCAFAVFFCVELQPLDREKLPRGTQVVHMQSGDCIVLVSGRACISVIMKEGPADEARFSVTSLLDDQVYSSWELFQDGHIRRIIERRDQGKPGQVVYLIDSDGDGIFETTIPAAR